MKLFIFRTRELLLLIEIILKRELETEKRGGKR